MAPSEGAIFGGSFAGCLVIKPKKAIRAVPAYRNLASVQSTDRSNLRISAFILPWRLSGLRFPFYFLCVLCALLRLFFLVCGSAFHNRVLPPTWGCDPIYLSWSPGVSVVFVNRCSRLQHRIDNSPGLLYIIFPRKQGGVSGHGIA